MADQVRKMEPETALVQLTIRVHPEARRRIKSRAALEDLGLEEWSRSLIYRELGLDNIPISPRVPQAAASSH